MLDSFYSLNRSVQGVQQLIQSNHNIQRKREKTCTILNRQINALV